MSYLYIKIVKKEKSIIDNVLFEIVTQEKNKGSSYLIKEDQEIEIHISKSESDKKEIAMGYAVELLKQEKYVIEITLLNEITKRTLVRDFHLTTVPWSADKESLTWYVEEVKQSESGMKIYITNRHRTSFGIRYYFEHGEVNAKLKVYIYKEVNIVTVISIIIAVLVVIVIICLGNIFRKKKRMKRGELKLKMDLNHEILKPLGLGELERITCTFIGWRIKILNQLLDQLIAIEKSHLDRLTQRINLVKLLMIMKKKIK